MGHEFIYDPCSAKAWKQGWRMLISYWLISDKGISQKVQVPEADTILFRFGDMHTNPALVGIKISPVDPKSIWILLSIAAGVLLIACINFTTLSIGRSASRAKEVGVRKVIGSSKKSLILQFLTESLLLAFLLTDRPGDIPTCFYLISISCPEESCISLLHSSPS